MGTIHQLVLTHGRQTARSLVSADQVPLVDVAARVLEDDSQALGITYSGFCLTALPHRRLPDDQPWERSSSNGRVSLLVEPGRVRRRTNPVSGEGEYDLIGVPYGPKARLILLYLQTRAIAENSPEVEIGRSMNAWLERMEISVGGRTYTEVRQQAERISRCRLTFFWNGDDGSEGFENTTIVAGGIRLRAGDDRQGSPCGRKPSASPMPSSRPYAITRCRSGNRRCASSPAAPWPSTSTSGWPTASMC